MTNNIDINNFEAVIFDMDGVLTDSEPIWKIAMETVFSEVGCDLTRKDFEKTVGLRIDEVVKYWYTVRPWDNYSCEQVEKMIVDQMIVLLNKNAEPLPGVLKALDFFKNKGLKIGLATSSYEVLIETILRKLEIKHYFDFTHSAEKEKYGKPHPKVYLTTAEKLNVSPLKCLVIEDSLTGIIAAKAARMKVVCVPEKTHEPNPKLIVSDWIYDDLNKLVQSIDL